MNFTLANNILDMRRAGADMPQIVVRKALEMTGDLEPQIYAEIPRSLPMDGRDGPSLRTQGGKVVQPGTGRATTAGGV